MACCGKRRRSVPVLVPMPSVLIETPFTVMGGYKYLNNQQITKRLQTFKGLYCKECSTEESCTYETYRMCEKAAKIENR